MKIVNLYPGSWGSNCYLLLSGSHAAVVDPSADPSRILAAASSAGATLELILLTHGHFDHIVSLDSLRDVTGAPALIHAADRELPSDARKNAFYTFFHMEKAYRLPEQTLADGEEIPLGNETIRLIHTPGHTKGSSCFLCNQEFLLTGDTLFDGNIGRTDLYGGNPQQLLESLWKLQSLPPHITIYPGHGNPALLGDTLDRVLS